MPKWVVFIDSERLPSPIVLDFNRCTVAGECLLDPIWSESYGVIVAGRLSTVVIAIVLDDLPIALPVILEKMAHLCNRAVTTMHTAAGVLVNANVPFPILNRARVVRFAEVTRVNIERVGC